MANSPTADTYTLPGRLFHYASTTPSHDAVVTATQTLSYSQLARWVRAQAQTLREAGISADSFVGIKCADDTHHLLLCLASAVIGARSTTLPSYEQEQTQAAIIRGCAITDVIGEEMVVDSPPADDDATTPPLADSACLLFSTSGTTGHAKLVVHHDSDLVAQAHRHIATHQERFACLASMEHNFAKRHRLYCVAMGATNVFPHNERGALTAQCQSLDVNVLHVSAFQAQELLAEPDISRLAHIRLKLGGSHVTESLRRQLKDGITRDLQAGYGTTETGAISFTDPEDTDVSESVGRPLPGIEVRVVSAEREPLACGEHGELAIRCAGMFRGYHEQPDLTNDRLADGWFYTGDIGYLDTEQRIHLRGRADDMFVFNSMNIFPQDIEAQICEFPGIVDAAVLPRPSSVHGNIPVALIVCASGEDPALSDIKAFVAEKAGVRCPRHFIRVDEIPRTATGKTSRREAARLLAPSPASREEEPHILKLFRRTFSYCDTVAQLNQALKTFEYRLTPPEVELLNRLHLSNPLIPSHADEKFHKALLLWFKSVRGMMANSGKTTPEPFVAHKIAPPVRLFRGPGEASGKTLLICFSDRGNRCLTMPNAVLLQHTDATQYDLMVVAEPFNDSYQRGVPLLGASAADVVAWIGQLPLVARYRRVRTIGCSAGAYPAVLTGYRLNAELAVSMGGRFHNEDEFAKTLKTFCATRASVRKGNCSSVLLSYAIEKVRDRAYAAIIGRLCGGIELAIGFSDECSTHLIFRQLAERGDLTSFLARTLFARNGAELIAGRKKAYIKFPKGEITRIPPVARYVLQRFGLVKPQLDDDRGDRDDSAPHAPSTDAEQNQNLPDLTLQRLIIRRSMVEALDATTAKSLRPAVLHAFAEGGKDIVLRHIGMNSLARMEMLIALELNHDVIITPHAFEQFRSFGEIAEHVIAEQTKTA